MDSIPIQRPYKINLVKLFACRINYCFSNLSALYLLSTPIEICGDHIFIFDSSKKLSNTR